MQPLAVGVLAEMFSIGADLKVLGTELKFGCVECGECQQTCLLQNTICWANMLCRVSSVVISSIHKDAKAAGGGFILLHGEAV
jgi:hypothetical protein